MPAAPLPPPLSGQPGPAALRCAAVVLAAGILAGCSGGGGGPSPAPAGPVPAPPSIAPPARQPRVAGRRWESSGPLSAQARAVLTAAFDRDPGAGDPDANAYDFAAQGGNKGMDWWNFPWDLPSSRPQYTLTWEDMRAMLAQVQVQRAREAPERIPYAQMLARMVDQLTPAIMNAHGGPLRVIKIIYCVRNFLAVACAQGLAEDIPPLNQAAGHLLALDATGHLANGHSPYLRGSSYHPRDLDGQPEDRTRDEGVRSLEDLRRRYLLP